MIVLRILLIIISGRALLIPLKKLSTILRILLDHDLFVLRRGHCKYMKTKIINIQLAVETDNNTCRIKNILLQQVQHIHRKLLMRDAHYVVIDTLETRVSVDTNAQVNIYKNVSLYSVTH